MCATVTCGVVRCGIFTPYELLYALHCVAARRKAPHGAASVDVKGALAWQRDAVILITVLSIGSLVEPLFA